MDKDHGNPIISRSHWTVQTVAVLLVSVLLLEVGLRIQQSVGPYYNLENRGISFGRVSDLVNHKPEPGRHSEQFAGEVFEKEFDQDGIRINHLRPKIPASEPAYRVLFAGDSFMEGYGDEHTIAQNVWNLTKGMRIKGKPLDLIEAGCVSYSPTIYIPQMKHLIPKVSPDFIVLTIDETDFGDDVLRYKDLVVRDPNGKIVAVKRSYVTDVYVKGFEYVRSLPLFTLRTLAKMYHTRVKMPPILRATEPLIPPASFKYSQDRGPLAREKFAEEIRLFENNLRELFAVLVEGVGSPKRVLISYHPHLEHLVSDEKGPLWNFIVRESVSKTARAAGVGFYDATMELKERFGKNPEKFYWPGDMHFNYAGLRAYSEGIAHRLLDQWKSSTFLSRDEPRETSREDL